MFPCADGIEVNCVLVVSALGRIPLWLGLFVAEDDRKEKENVRIKTPIEVADLKIIPLSSKENINVNSPY